MSDIEQALSRAADGQFTHKATLELSSPHKYVAFSDQHKGGGDRADEFRKCRDTYVAALNHYLQNGFTLILLGDVEELWEQGFKTVKKTHSDVLELEGSFPANRYYRVWGNHDDKWMTDGEVSPKLRPFMPTSSIYESLRFEVTDHSKPAGTILMLHGHQGTFESDKIRGISRLAVRVYRYLQRLTGIGKQTPAKDACLRGQQDTNMYNWAARQDHLILIAGHTHRPVWSSRTHLQKLEKELGTLIASDPKDSEAIAAKQKEVEERREKYPPCNDTEKTTPAYFNTGCCKFDDGDITGIELEDGELRLIKWSHDDKRRIVLEKSSLKAILDQL